MTDHGTLSFGENQQYAVIPKHEFMALLALETVARMATTNPGATFDGTKNALANKLAAIDAAREEPA